MSDIDELAAKIAAALPGPTRAAPPPAFNFPVLFSGAPAWITLMILFVLGGAAINTRVSTLEYQASMSIADRATIHQELDKSSDSISQIRTDLAEIKTTLKQLVDQRGNNNTYNTYPQAQQASPQAPQSPPRSR